MEIGLTFIGVYASDTIHLSISEVLSSSNIGFSRVDQNFINILVN